MVLLDVRVAARRQEAQDICSFDLVPAQQGIELPVFQPGAHIDVHVPGGWVRQYSLWNDPSERNLYRIGVLKEHAGRGGSRAMHDTVKVGSALQVAGPRNQFALAPTAGKHLLLAGGIGITPLLCMAQVLAGRGDAFALHYCTRSSPRAAFADRLGSGLLAPHVHMHLDDGPPEQKLRIDELLQAQASDVHLYTCGPKGFMDAVLGQARSLGWNEGRLHHEFFQGEIVPQDGDQAFDVQLARSGRTVAVAVGQTVVEALAAAGVPIPTSCEQGICGTCVTRVLEGVPDHRDTFLVPEERASNKCFTPCCSRSQSPILVLDL